MSCLLSSLNMKGQIVASIRAIDTAGKNRQAFGHRYAACMAFSSCISGSHKKLLPLPTNLISLNSWIITATAQLLENAGKEQKEGSLTQRL